MCVHTCVCVCVTEDRTQGLGDLPQILWANSSSFYLNFEINLQIKQENCLVCWELDFWEEEGEEEEERKEAVTKK
jgi:hypothetical protein